MNKSILQVLVTLLACLALVSNVFADKVQACDMAHENTHSMEQMADMSGHEHHMAMMEMSDEAETDSNSEDCCGEECQCQHGVCSTFVFIQSSVLASSAFNKNAPIQLTQTNAASIINPSLFRPPIV